MNDLIIFMNLLLAVVPPDTRPMPDEGKRFPSSEVVQDSLNLNRAYGYVIAQKLALMGQLDVRRPYWEQVKAENEQIEQVWEALRPVQWEWTANNYTHKRDYLQKLKDLIGDEAFFQGAMPPPFPIWRFCEIEW